MEKKQLFNYSVNLQQPVESVSPQQMLAEANNYFHQGFLQQAESLYLKILEAQPDFSDAMNMLAVIKSKSGKQKEAERYILNAIKFNPEYPQYYNNLGRIYDAQDELIKARKSYEKALSIDPDLEEVLMNVGLVLVRLGEYEEAEKIFLKVMDKYPQNKKVYQNLAELYHTTGQLDKIEAIYLKGIASNNGEKYSYLFFLAGHYEVLGRSDEGIKTYRQCIDYDPERPQAYFGLTRAQKNKRLDEALAAKIKSLIETGACNEKDAAYLNFSLGKMYHDASMYDEAFKHYSEGNRLNNTRQNYDREETEELFSSIKEIFNRDFVANRQLKDSISDLPVFIVGMPRCGSTLIEQIIASHPRVEGAGELSHLIAKTRTIPKFFNIGKKYPYFLEDINQELLTSVAWEYIGLLKSEIKDNTSPARITDKQLYNFLHIGFIKILFPEAKIIHCRRNSLENCLGIFFAIMKDFSMHSYAYDLENLGHYYRLYLDLMEFWHEQLPGALLDLDYENLVNNQETESRRLIEYIGLDWDDRCIEFYKTVRPVSTYSNLQVKQPIFRDALDRASHYAAYLEPLKKALESKT